MRGLLFIQDPGSEQLSILVAAGRPPNLDPGLVQNNVSDAPHCLPCPDGGHTLKNICLKVVLR